MEARESNCSILKEPEVSPLRRRAMEMKASQIRGLLIAAYPERVAVITLTRLKASCYNSKEDVSVIDMIVALWEEVDDAGEDEI